jgi:hypothetical protein
MDTFTYARMHKSKNKQEHGQQQTIDKKAT